MGCTSASARLHVLDVRCEPGTLRHGDDLCEVCSGAVPQRRDRLVGEASTGLRVVRVRRGLQPLRQPHNHRGDTGSSGNPCLACALGVLEINLNAFAIFHRALVEHLEEQFQHVRVGFFHFVKQHHAVGPAAHGFQSFQNRNIFGAVAGLPILGEGIATKDVVKILAGIGTILVGLFAKDNDSQF